MKTRYVMIIIVLILGAVGFGLLVCLSQLAEYPRLENAVRSAGIFVALTATVVALLTLLLAKVIENEKENRI